jgi:hypothetical protein
MARRPFLALALALVLSGAAGCLYSPKGRCDTHADCAASELCDEGVCVHSLGGGVDPTSFTTVFWSKLAGQSGVTFAVDSVGADLDGNVIVAGTVDAAFDFDPGAVVTTVPPGAFALKRAAGNGAAVWAVSFPTFEHGQFKTAVLPDGDVFFAGTAFEPTTIGTCARHDILTGNALVFGRLAGTDGSCRWSLAVDDTHPTSAIVPAAVAVRGASDLLVAGTGSGDFECPSGDTAGQTFAAALSGTDGSCAGASLWSRGFGTQTLSDIEPSGATTVVVAGVCTPAGASFDPDGTTTCTKGLFIADLSDTTGATGALRTTSGAGTVAAVHDLTVAPDGRRTVVGDASGVVDFGGGPIVFGAAVASFAATFDPAGGSTVVRPIESPYDADPDALAFSRCAYDRTGRLWIAGPYVGQPTLGGIRFSACRAPDCLAAAFLARLDANSAVSSFLPIRAAPDANGSAFVDDLALFATTDTVAHALRFTGVAPVGASTWTSMGGDLGVLRIVP